MISYIITPDYTLSPKLIMILGENQALGENIIQINRFKIYKKMPKTIFISISQNFFCYIEYKTVFHSFLNT